MDNDNLDYGEDGSGWGFLIFIVIFLIIAHLTITG